MQAQPSAPALALAGAFRAHALLAQPPSSRVDNRRQQHILSHKVHHQSAVVTRILLCSERHAAKSMCRNVPP